MKFSGFPEGICFFHSTSRGKHSYLRWILVCVRTDSCMFGWPALTNLSGNLKDRFADCGLRCFFHGEPLVNPTDAFFFSFFFGSAISPTRLSNTNHSIGRAWHQTFPPRLFDPSDPVSSLHVWHPLYAWSVCPAFVWRTRESKGKRFRGFRTTSLIYSNKLARNLEKEQERYLRDFGKDRIISTSNNNLGLTVESLNKLNWLIDFFINKFNYDKYADIFGKIN